MRRFILFTSVLSLAVVVSCQRDKSPLKSEYQFGLLPILKQNAIIRISPEMNAVWPGGDHLVEFQYDLKNEHSGVNIKPSDYQSVAIKLTLRTGTHEMYDDGKHMDGQLGDGVYGYYELVDSSQADFRAIYHIYIEGRLYTSRYLTTVPFKGTPPVPKLIHPVGGAAVHELTPTFSWQKIPGVDEYGIIIWDKQPMPETFEKNVIFHKEIADSSATSFLLQETQLTPGKIYWWALWAYDWKVFTSSMNWGKFEVGP